MTINELSINNKPITDYEAFYNAMMSGNVKVEKKNPTMVEMTIGNFTLKCALTEYSIKMSVLNGRHKRDEFKEQSHNNMERTYMDRLHDAIRVKFWFSAFDIMDKDYKVDIKDTGDDKYEVTVIYGMLNQPRYVRFNLENPLKEPDETCDHLLTEATALHTDWVRHELIQDLFLRLMKKGNE